MNAVLVSKENNVAKFTMAFTAEEFDAALDKAYKAQRGKIEVPGFRKGKAPRSVIEKRYGEGIFFEDAIDNCLADGYPAALDQLALEPVDRPDLSFGEEKLVDILCQAETFLHISEVVGNATKNHVKFQNVFSAKGKVGTFGKEFALPEREGNEFYTIGQPSAKTALVLQELLADP